MKICIAQTRSIKADIQRNIDHHKTFIELAVSHGADMIFYPELSLTAYEPRLVRELATNPDDSRFEIFQTISDANQLTIGVGMPTTGDTGIRISMLIFQPHQARQTYSKQHLHTDEQPYFVSGQHPVFLTNNKTKVALAICYELSVPEHAEHAYKSGAGVYIASVAKTAQGVEKAAKTLTDIAKNYSMTVLMCNCIGQADGEECGGKTAIWNTKGELIGQLDDTHEGILMIDTETQKIIEKTL